MEPTLSVVVPVVGMHRSGTSMVARMLQAGGVAFGPDAVLAGPDIDNPHGFWEHRGLRSINEELLRRCGGDWRNPPQIEAQFLQDGCHDDLRSQAKTLLQALASSAPCWGWKDPRMCLLLPFWLPLLPSKPRTILCLRHPAAIAASLAKRNQLPTLLVGFLWQEYLARACMALSESQVLLISYEAILSDAPLQAARMKSFLQVEGDFLDIHAMVAAVDRGLAHHPAQKEDFCGWWPQGKEFYEQLLAGSAEDISWSEISVRRPQREDGFIALMEEASRLAVALDTCEHAYRDRAREEREARAAVDELKEKVAQVEDGKRQEQEERMRQADRSHQLERENVALCAEFESYRSHTDNLHHRAEVRIGTALRRLVCRAAGLPKKK